MKLHKKQCSRTTSGSISVSGWCVRLKPWPQVNTNMVFHCNNTHQSMYACPQDRHTLIDVDSNRLSLWCISARCYNVAVFSVRIASSVVKLRPKLTYLSLPTSMCYTHVEHGWPSASTAARLLLLVNSTICNIPKMRVSSALFPYKSVDLAQNGRWQLKIPPFHNATSDFDTDCRWQTKITLLHNAASDFDANCRWQTFRKVWTTVFSAPETRFSLVLCEIRVHSVQTDSKPAQLNSCASKLAYTIDEKAL